MEKLITCNDSEAEELAKQIGVTKFGDWNHLIEPVYEKTTMKELMDMLFSYSPQFIEHRQVYVDKEHRELQTVKIIYFHSKIFVIKQVWKTHSSDDIEYEVYLAGCKHDFAETTIGHCLHEYKCKKCGFKQTIDSSD